MHARPRLIHLQGQSICRVLFVQRISFVFIDIVVRSVNMVCLKNCYYQIRGLSQLKYMRIQNLSSSLMFAAGARSSSDNDKYRLVNVEQRALFLDDCLSTASAV
jgi:hypothetical protein